MSLLKLARVSRLIGLVSLVETFSYLNLTLLYGQFHFCLQFKKLVLVFTLNLLPQAPLIVKVSFPLNLNFLNFRMLGLDEFFTALDFNLYLVPQFLYIFLIHFYLLIICLVVFHQLRFLGAGDLFHGISFEKLLFRFNQLLIK